MNVIIENVSVDYGKTRALNKVSAHLKTGQLNAIVGQNGSGKSTLVKAIIGMQKTTTGSILFDGQPWQKVRKKVTYVPQRETVDWEFPINCIDVVKMGRLSQKKWPRWYNKQDRNMAENALEKVGMIEFANKQIGQLSGGQQQRIFIARALVSEADTYIMDEPFAGIDLASEEKIMQIVIDITIQGKTIIMVHHDLLTVQKHFDHLLLLKTDKIAEGSVAEVLTQPLLAQAYGGGFALLSQFSDAV